MYQSDQIQLINNVQTQLAEHLRLEDTKLTHVHEIRKLHQKIATLQNEVKLHEVRVAQFKAFGIQQISERDMVELRFNKVVEEKQALEFKLNICEIRLQEVSKQYDQQLVSLTTKTAELEKAK